MRTHYLFCALLAVSQVPLHGGCATFGRRAAALEKIAAGRELSRQGVAALEMGNWQQAEVLLQQALQASPDDAETHRYLAEALWNRGATDRALSHISDAARLDPADAALAVRAGEMALEVGAHHDALRRAEQAIGHNPQLASAWLLRGRAFWRLNNLDRATADLQRALELAPEDSAALFDLALVYRQRGQAARSLATLHNLLDTYPPGEEPQVALMWEGLTLLEMQRPHQAVESLQAAARRQPANADVFYRLAQAQFSAGRFSEATQAAEQALAVDRAHQPSRELLTQLAASTPAAEAQRR
jgi:tetratricopeptide (TPR) repeat protein